MTKRLSYPDINLFLSVSIQNNALIINNDITCTDKTIKSLL